VTGQRGPRLSHSKPLHVAVFRPRTGGLVLTGSIDGVAQLWETKTGKPYGRPLRHDQAIMAAAFSPDGDVFFTASHDGTLCLWRTADQAPLFSCKHAESILAGAFSHDGKRILIGCGKAGRLYDATRGTVLDPPLVHQDKVRAVAFSP